MIVVAMTAYARSDGEAWEEGGSRREDHGGRRGHLDDKGNVVM